MLGPVCVCVCVCVLYIIILRSKLSELWRMIANESRFKRSRNKGTALEELYDYIYLSVF